MKALIWAAGLGTRLRPLTEHMPKAMIPIANKPMLEYSIQMCKDAGITDIAINLHYFSDTIKKHFDDGKKFGVNITYSYEEELLENAGALIKLKEFFKDEQDIVTIASDNLTDINLKQMIHFHKKNNALVTIATTKAEDVSKYGIVAHDNNGKIKTFQEKPHPSKALSDQIATCVYVFNKRIFDFLPQTMQKLHFGKDIFPSLLNQKEELYAYTHKGYWNDVGNPTNYLQANFDFFKTTWAQHKNNFIDNTAEIHESAEIISPVMIAPHVRIEKGARVGPYACIDKKTTIHRDSRISRSILGKNTVLEENVTLKDSILGDNSYIYQDMQVSQTVLGQKSYLNKIES